MAPRFLLEVHTFYQFLWARGDGRIDARSIRPAIRCSAGAIARDECGVTTRHRNYHSLGAVTCTSSTPAQLLESGGSGSVFSKLHSMATLDKPDKRQVAGFGPTFFNLCNVTLGAGILSYPVRSNLLWPLMPQA